MFADGFFYWFGAVFGVASALLILFLVYAVVRSSWLLFEGGVARLMKEMELPEGIGRAVQLSVSDEKNPEGTGNVV